MGGAWGSSICRTRSSSVGMENPTETSGGSLEDVQIPGDQGGPGEDIDAPAVLPQDLQAAPGQAVAGFHGLVGIADAGQEGPARLFFAAQFGSQDVQEIDLDFHETAPGRGRVMATVAAHEDGVAIATAMRAAQVRIDDILHPGNFGAH